MLDGSRIPGRVSSGGGCRLYDAADGAVALNLARPADRELLPALFETDGFDDDRIEAHIARCDADALVTRGREMGLAIAAEDEAVARQPAVTMLTSGRSAIRQQPRAPRVLDLSALWAGPLAAHLLRLAGTTVTKVESSTRPDAMRDGGALFALLDGDKRSVTLDFRDPDDRRALLALIAASDIVIEAARPRALVQLGIDADELVRTVPGLSWITITGHGATGDAANWVGFGDDCGVAAGLSAALRAATGKIGFVGDAIADPLTGIRAAQVAWEGWSSGRGGRFGLSMTGVAAQALAEAAADPDGLTATLQAWAAAVGMPYPSVPDRTARC